LPSPSSLLSQYFPFPNTSSQDRNSSFSSQGQGADSAAALQNESYEVFDQGTKSCSESGDDSLPSASSSLEASSPPLRHSRPNGTTHNTAINGSENTGSFADDPQDYDTPRPRDQPSAESSRPRPQAMYVGQPQGSANPVFPFSRPYSLPQGHSNSYSPGQAVQSPKPTKPTWPDRSSSASLPLPMQTPYYTLPQVTTSATVEEDQELQDPPDREAEMGPWKPPASSQNGPVSSGPDAGPARLPSPTAPSIRTPPAPHRLDPPRTPATSYAEPPLHPMSRPMPASSVSSYPAPEAPVIMTPPPPPAGSGRPNQAPYEPFLCHNAVSEERHSIAIETSTGEYRLVVNLPGFRRDAM
jgi:hypothetical protein